jgi:NAD(P)-dependent dehydrogenase (short-subunit alcohol dehydrogenase family)
MGVGLDLCAGDPKRLQDIADGFQLAGTMYAGPAHDAFETAWDAVLDTNLKAGFLLSKAVAPEMIRR